MTGEYTICTRCVMDSSATDISFDTAGVCNYCREFEQRSKSILSRTPGERADARNRLVAQIKARGARKRYDCVVGVSGGVDSSWALVQTVRHGLRPLAVHMDNGWNSELAQNNISNLVRSLNVDLYTHVIDWTEYRSLMQAFFDADVVDVELLYDNAMLAVNYQQAASHGVAFILAGTNQATEGMRMPVQWNWLKYDKRNIKSLARTFGRISLRTFPSIGTLGFIWYEFLRRIRWISFLDYFDYRKSSALDELKTEFKYKPYPFKHYESVFTRFYQGYLLREKFGIDKRRLHFSTLIVSGQMTRQEALAGLEGIPYPSERALESDKQYFLKKMGWTSSQLTTYLRRPPRSHASYHSERALWNWCANTYLRARRLLL